MQKFQKQVSGLIITFTVLVSLVFFCSHRKQKPVLYGDTLGYYLYLPSTLIYDNLQTPDSLPRDKGIPPDVIWYTEQHRADPVSPKGYRLNQYTYGVALMEAPFFLAAHAWEKISGGQANGFSGAYEQVLWFSTWLYVLLGCILTYKVLCRFSKPGIALATICLVFLGSNLFWFTWIQPGMAHTPLFFLYAALIWLSIRITERPSAGRFAALGLCIGLITLIRPTDIICILIPLGYQVCDIRSAKAKGQFLWQHRSKIVLLIIAALLPVIPQLLYWKWLAGSWLYYSYGDQQFNWEKPKIIEGLFYAGNGWLAYSPLFFGAFAGMVFLRRYRAFALSLFLLLPLYIYIIYSWYCYNYINGFGSRPMIHLYPLLAIPLAVLLQKTAESKVITRIIVAVLALFCVYVNLNLSTRQVNGQLESDHSNINYNLELLLKPHLDYDAYVCRDNGIRQPNPAKLHLLKTLQCISYEDSLTEQYQADPTGKSRYVYAAKQGEPYPLSKIEFSYTPELFGPARWMRCRGRFYMTEASGGGTAQLLVLGVYRGDQNIDWASCSISNKIGIAGDRDKENAFEQGKAITDTWGTVGFYMPVPRNIQAGDKIMFLVWNAGERPFLMDDLCLELYD